MRNFVLILVSVASLIGIAHAEELKSASYYEAQTKALRESTWYDSMYTGQRPATLSAAIAADKAELGADNPYWKEVSAPGLKNICAAMHSVGLKCDYNTRITLSLFLTFNGKGMFPAKGGTNPYFTEYKSGDFGLDDGFVGHPPQNDMLAAAIRKNAKLFRNGDLTTEAVKSWK